MRLIPPLALLCAACSESVVPSDPVFELGARNVWAGSSVTIESDAFIGLVGTPELRLDDLVAPLERADDTTFLISVPGTASGSYNPTITIGGRMHFLPPLQVAGFTGSEEFSTVFTWDLQTWPGTGHATVVGAANRDAALVFIDLAAGVERKFPGVIDGRIRGPGVSYRPGVLFGSTVAGIDAYQVGGGRLSRLGPTGVPFARQFMELGPGIYLTTGTIGINMVGGPGYSHHLSEPESVVLSVAAGRATLTADGSSRGLPVFRVPEGTLAYLLEDVRRPTAVAFSQDGAVLAIAQAAPAFSPDVNTIRLFRAADGAPLAGRDLPSAPFAVAFDPVRPILYVGLSGTPALYETSKPRLLVLHRETLEVLGEMSAEGSALECHVGCYKGVIAVSSEPAVYVAVSWGLPTRSYRFSIIGAP